jgi:hypothetical protein
LIKLRTIILTAIASLTIAITGHATDYIADAGSDEEATTAFNDLQDQFGRPHAKIVHYDSATDTYHWIGPKLHKRMSLKREEFNDQVWYPYWKSHHPPRAELVATPTPEPTPERPFASYAPAATPLATPAATTTEASTPTEVTSHSSGVVGGALVGLIFLVAFVWGLFKVFPQIFSSFGSSTPSSPPVTDEDVARQLKTLKVLMLANQPDAEHAIDCLRNPRVDSLNISDSTGHVIDLKGENGQPWLIPYRCPQYMPRKGEILLWGFDNIKYWHQGTHSEYHGGSVGVSFRVARGLWVRTGQHRGHSVSHESMDYKGLGTLLLTNQGFAFMGTSTIRVLFSHIVSFEPYKDGVGFETEQVRNNKYMFNNMSAMGASFIDDAINLLNGGSSRLIAALPAPPPTAPPLPTSTAPPLPK